MTSARAREQLRQERETFDQAKRHDARWFGLRLAMGYATIALFLATAPIAGYVVLRPSSYYVPTIVIAAKNVEPPRAHRDGWETARASQSRNINPYPASAAEDRAAWFRGMTNILVANPPKV